MNARVANIDGALAPMGGALMHEKTVAGTATALVGTMNRGTKAVFWTVDGGDVRVTFDGTDPSATKGHLIMDGSSGTWSRGTAAAARAIRTGSDSGYFVASEMTEG